MSTMNISLPDELKVFVDQQVGSRGYASSSEYVRELLRREHDKEKLRALILEGVASGRGVLADKAYFDGLRQRARQQAARAKPVAKPAQKSARKSAVKG